MKNLKLILLFQFLCITFLSSQTMNIDEEFRTQFSEILKHPFETGILSNASVIRIERNRFKANLDQPQLQDKFHFATFYNGCYNARSENNQWIVESEKAYKERHRQLNEIENKLSLSICAVEYEYLEEDDATKANIISQDGVLTLKNKSNFTSQIHKNRAYVSTLNKYEFNSQKVSFSFTKEDLIGNIPIANQSIVMDFGDGNKPVDLEFKKEYEIDYKSWGTKSLRLSVSDKQGNRIEHSYKLNLIKAQKNTSPILRGADLGLTCNTSGTDECMEFGTETKILASFQFNCGDEFSDLRKPIIFLDGIDLFWNTNRMTAEKFLFENEKNLSTVIDEPINGESTTVANYLKDNGYDLIFVDYFDHHTDIEKNASAVQELLTFVNSMLIQNNSPFETTMIGFSMGGVIGKYALLDMENKGLDHGAQKYISFDAPMQGANIPLAIQGLVRHAAEIINGTQSLAEEAENDNFLRTIVGVDKVLDSQSPQQLLQQIYRKNKTDISSPENIALYDKLEAFGELKECEYFAISNGSRKGFPQGRQQSWDPNESVPDDSNNLFEINVLPDSFEDVGSVFDFFMWLMSSLIDVKIKTVGYYQDGSPNVTVYEGDFTIKVFGPLNDIEFVHNPLTIAQSSIIDVAPGGSFPISAIIPSGVPIATLNAINGFQLNPFPDFCFIPTYSGLDIQGGTLDMIIGNHVDTPAEMWSAQEEHFLNEDLGVHFENNIHIGIVPDNIYFLTDVLVGDPAAFGDENNTLNTTYNFGRTERVIVEEPHIPNFPSSELTNNLTVSTGGQLKVNNTGLLAYGTASDNQNTEDSNYRLTVGGGYCGPESIVLSVVNNGKFDIGDIDVDNIATAVIGSQASLSILKGGKVKVDESSTLLIAEGGTLELDDKSELSIEEDAVLIIKGNVNIVGNVVLEPKGKIILYPSAQFSINGTLSIKGLGEDHEIIFTDNTNVSVSNLSLIENSLLSFGSNARLHIYESNSFSLIDSEISNQEDFFYQAPLVGLLSTYAVKSVALTNVEVSNVTKAQSINIRQGISCTISGSYFNSLKKGIQVSNYNSLLVENSNFVHEGVHQRGLILDNINSGLINRSRFITIEEDDLGINGNTDIQLNNVFDFEVESSQFKDGTYGIAVPTIEDGADNTNIKLGQVYMAGYDKAAVFMGMRQNYGKLEIECSTFSKNRICVKGTNITLILDYPLANGIGANSFSRFVDAGESNNPILYIDYTLDDIDQIYVRGNSWGFSGPISSDFFITNSSGTTSTFVDVISSPYVTGVSSNCRPTHTDGSGPRSNSNDVTSGLILSPNPVTNFLDVSGVNYAKYIITTTTGSTISQGGADRRIVLTDLAKGLYFITFIDSLGNSIEAGKFIKI